MVCAARPLLALNRKHIIDGNEEPSESFPRPLAGSDNWQNHASALDRLSRESFSVTVGSSFKVLEEGSAQPVWLTLQAVEDLPRISAANLGSVAVARRQSSPAITTSGFVLLFGSSAQMLQGTRLFEHDGLGRFALFIVPEADGRYTGLVNRLDGPTIIAVPFQQEPGGNGVNKNITPAGITLAPATSSGSEAPSPGLSGIPGARRNALRD
jgi:uncharacterized protein DUF6916